MVEEQMRIVVISGAGAIGMVTVRDLTGMPLSVTSQMLAKGLTRQTGVLHPEAAIEPEPFFAEIAKRGVKITETTRTIHLL